MTNYHRNMSQIKYIIKFKLYISLGFVHKAENSNNLTKLKTTRKLAESDTKKSISDGSTYETKRIIKIYKIKLISLNSIFEFNKI